jgi:hypothetical protein
MESVSVRFATYDARVLRTPPHPNRLVARRPLRLRVVMCFVDGMQQ